MTRCLILLMLMLIGTPAFAGTPIYLGEVLDDQQATGIDATRLFEALSPDQKKQIQPSLNQLSREMIRRIETSDRFDHQEASTGWAELPDDLLLMVLSVEAAEDLVTTFDRGSDLVSLLMAVSVQLADPRTGQVVYADFELVNSGIDFDEDWNAEWEAGFNSDPMKAAIFGEQKIDRAGGYAVMLEKTLGRMVDRCLETFDPRPVTAKIVRMVNGRALVNKGRTAGFFQNTRLASPDGELVLAIEESFYDYSFATIVSGPEKPEAWTVVQGYRASAEGAGSTLVGVSRFIFSEDVLSNRDLSELAADEQLFRDRIAGKPQARRDLYQSVLAFQLTRAMSKTGEFRMAYPMAGLASLNRAKVRMNTSLNLKRRDDDPFFFESLVIPDLSVVGIISNPISGRTPIIENGRAGNKQQRYIGALCDLHLCETRGLAVLASGHARGMDGYEVQARINGGMLTDVGRPHLRFLKRALCEPPNEWSEGAIFGAVRALAAQYQAGDVSLPIHRGDEAEMELKVANPAIIGSGTPATVCYVMGELALEPEAENKVPILDVKGRGAFTDHEDGTWYVDMASWEDGVPDETLLKNAVIPVYGVNEQSGDEYGLGAVKIVGVGADGVSDEDATFMLLASAGSYPGFPLVLPDSVKQSVREYQFSRFGQDAAYNAGDEFAKPGQPAGEGPVANMLEIEIQSADKMKQVPPDEQGRMDNKMKGVMQIDWDLDMRLYLRGDKAQNLEITGVKFTRKKSEELPADRWVGVDGARVYLWGVLHPKFMNHFRSKRLVELSP